MSSVAIRIPGCVSREGVANAPAQSSIPPQPHGTEWISIRMRAPAHEEIMTEETHLEYVALAFVHELQASAILPDFNVQELRVTREQAHPQSVPSPEVAKISAARVTLLEVVDTGEDGNNHALFIGLAGVLALKASCLVVERLGPADLGFSPEFSLLIPRSASSAVMVKVPEHKNSVVVRGQKACAVALEADKEQSTLDKDRDYATGVALNSGALDGFLLASIDADLGDMVAFSAWVRALPASLSIAAQGTLGAVCSYMNPRQRENVRTGTHQRPSLFEPDRTLALISALLHCCRQTSFQFVLDVCAPLIWDPEDVIEMLNRVGRKVADAPLPEGKLAVARVARIAFVQLVFVLLESEKCVLAGEEKQLKMAEKRLSRYWHGLSGLRMEPCVDSSFSYNLDELVTGPTFSGLNKDTLAILYDVSEILEMDLGSGDGSWDGTLRGACGSKADEPVLSVKLSQNVESGRASSHQTSTDRHRMTAAVSVRGRLNAEVSRGRQAGSQHSRSLQPGSPHSSIIKSKAGASGASSQPVAKSKGARYLQLAQHSAAAAASLKR
ncbi:hypothetical protein FVE85_6469 [Porphyridium purpureum]|uniref:Uncharacterized protein n=1 Tax=Porphyridium purpureum TaxID=35688 RepID=A0A5J4Z7D2_PORPP|nr:hypothetical protein FVE85_6469 [Porphyridium purpureum]|eukprot:POR3653..scf295_1